MFAEDFAPFFDIDAFAVPATLEGAAKTVIFDTSSVDEFGTVTQAPSVLMTATDAFGATQGQTMLINFVSYVVRSVNAQPPDGALVRLDLVRV